MAQLDEAAALGTPIAATIVTPQGQDTASPWEWYGLKLQFGEIITYHDNDLGKLQKMWEEWLKR